MKVTQSHYPVDEILKPLSNDQFSTEINLFKYNLLGKSLCCSLVIAIFTWNEGLWWRSNNSLLMKFFRLVNIYYRPINLRTVHFLNISQTCLPLSSFYCYIIPLYVDISFIFVPVLFLLLVDVSLRFVEFLLLRQKPLKLT